MKRHFTAIVFVMYDFGIVCVLAKRQLGKYGLGNADVVFVKIKTLAETLNLTTSQELPIKSYFHKNRNIPSKNIDFTYVHIDISEHYALTRRTPDVDLSSSTHAFLLLSEHLSKRFINIIFLICQHSIQGKSMECSGWLGNDRCLDIPVSPSC